MGLSAVVVFLFVVGVCFALAGWLKDADVPMWIGMTFLMLSIIVAAITQTIDEQARTWQATCSTYSGLVIDDGWDYVEVESGLLVKLPDDCTFVEVK